MATSRFETEMYVAEKFVEGAGTVLFRLSTRQVCVLRPLHRDEYVLPKGRRNLGESRRTTAIRETTKETGNALPLVASQPVQTRRIGEGELKLIWWFMAAVIEDEPVGQREEHKFEVEFHDYDTVLEILTDKDDRELVRKAIELTKASVAS
ncbi:hypothetical protein S40293_07162 [Stachybotrys chartarum IBT 40293]|nr:hypothetical protein S40293_07162 [Stachybotrys chartarum IBT 40293]